MSTPLSKIYLVYILLYWYKYNSESLWEMFPFKIYADTVTIFSFLWWFLRESVNTISIDLQVNLKNAGAPLKNKLLNVFFSLHFSLEQVYFSNKQFLQETFQDKF